jgi:CDP-glucose 4,6-dehydratase
MEKLVNMNYNNVFAGKKVVVTGNTGFKGAWLSIWLMLMGARVYGISKDIPTDPSIFKVANLEEHLKHHYIDITDKEALIAKIVEIAPDFVFHLAAQPLVAHSYKYPVDSFATNLMGTINVLEALKLCNHACTAVMITSDKCYDNVEWLWGYKETDALGGKDPYSASKGCAEIAIKSYYHSYFNKPNSLIKIASVRAGNVIGGGDWAENRIVPDSIKSWSKSEPVKIRSPYATRPWQHVLEPLSGYLLVAQQLFQETKGINGEAFNFGPSADQNATVLHLLETLAYYWKPNFETFDIEQTNTFHEAGLLKLNCDKALALLKWKPVLNFNQTCSYTAKWYKDFYFEKKLNVLDLMHLQINNYINQAKELNLSWTK